MPCKHDVSLLVKCQKCDLEAKPQESVSQERPCVRTLETGKHAWNTLESEHFPNARIWIRKCPTCGWIDTEEAIRESLEKFAKDHVRRAVEDFRARVLKTIMNADLAEFAKSGAFPGGIGLEKAIRALPLEAGDGKC